jgi:NADP-dependent 3-hydroxy acid dehydrogenase YdfG
MELLSGKRAIISGASSGIGQAIALEYVKQGAIVGLIARRVENLKNLVNEINETGGKAYYEQADVSQYSQVKKAINSLVQSMGRLDIIIANAGVNIMTAPDPPKKDQIRFNDISEESFDKVANYINNIIDINLKGEFYTINAGLFHLMKTKIGRGISTSSIMAVKPFIVEPYYAATKAGKSWLK